MLVGGVRVISPALLFVEVVNLHELNLVDGQVGGGELGLRFQDLVGLNGAFLVGVPDVGLVVDVLRSKQLDLAGSRLHELLGRFLASLLHFCAGRRAG